VDDVDRPFENQGVAYENEVVHEHDEPNVIQGVVHDNNYQDAQQITEINTVDLVTHSLVTSQQQSNS